MRLRLALLLLLALTTFTLAEEEKTYKFDEGFDQWPTGEALEVPPGAPPIQVGGGEVTVEGQTTKESDDTLSTESAEVGGNEFGDVDSLTVNSDGSVTFDSADNVQLPSSEGPPAIITGAQGGEVSADGTEYSFDHVDTLVDGDNVVFDGNNVKKEGNELSAGDAATLGGDVSVASNVEEAKIEEDTLSFEGASAVLIDDTLLNDLGQSEITTNDEGEIVLAELTSAIDDNILAIPDKHEEASFEIHLEAQGTVTIQQTEERLEIVPGQSNTDIFIGPDLPNPPHTLFNSNSNASYFVQTEDGYEIYNGDLFYDNEVLKESLICQQTCEFTLHHRYGVECATINTDDSFTFTEYTSSDRDFKVEGRQDNYKLCFRSIQPQSFGTYDALIDYIEHYAVFHEQILFSKDLEEPTFQSYNQVGNAKLTFTRNNRLIEQIEVDTDNLRAGRNYNVTTSYFEIVETDKGTLVKIEQAPYFDIVASYRTSNQATPPLEINNEHIVVKTKNNEVHLYGPGTKEERSFKDQLEAYYARWKEKGFLHMFSLA